MATYTVRIEVNYPMRGEIHSRIEKRTFNAKDGNIAIEYVKRFLIPRVATPMKFPTYVLSLKLAYPTTCGTSVMNPNATVQGCDDCLRTPFQLAFWGGHDTRIEH